MVRSLQSATPPDSLLSLRDQWAADLDCFDAMLKASGSATATLIDWMWTRSRKAGAITALVRSERRPTLPDGLLKRLQMEDASCICYRRVWLVQGGRILSDAQNWYVPERLTEEMRKSLAGGRIPFGSIVESLMPVRETISARRLWPPGLEESSWSGRLPSRVLHHHALVCTRAGEPICEVSECYTRNILR